jgi:hypothetical protein
LKQIVLVVANCLRHRSKVVVAVEHDHLRAGDANKECGVAAIVRPAVAEIARGSASAPRSGVKYPAFSHTGYQLFSASVGS